MNTDTTEAAAARAPDGDGTPEMLFPERRPIRDAMRAARTIIAAPRRYDGRRTCRLLSPAGRPDITIVACDGHRLGWTVIDNGRSRAGDDVDVALAPGTVRWIARCKGTGPVRIRSGQDWVCTETLEDVPARLDDQTGQGLETAALETARDALDWSNALRVNLHRKQAMTGLRDMPPQVSPVSRFEIRSNGTVRGWATTADLVGPDYEPEWCAASVRPGGHDGGADTGEPDRKMVFAIDRNHLRETLRGMSSQTVTMLVTEFDCPVKLVGDNGREEYLISTKRLCGTRHIEKRRLA